MPVKKSKSRVNGVFAAALLCCASAHANLVMNGSFESGDFSGWTTTPGGLTSLDGVDIQSPQAGDYAAYFGNSSGVSVLSQTLATIAGSTYAVSFWLKNEADVNGASAPNSFEFDWGGAAVMTVINASAFDYTKYELLLTATGSSTDLSFSFSQQPAFWDFDSVDVQSVPEPASLALTGIGGALALLVSRRRRDSPAPEAHGCLTKRSGRCG